MTASDHEGAGRMPDRYWDPDLPAAEHDDPGHVREHFDPLSPSLTRGRYTRISRAMARECPVIHTDGFGDGVWTVSGYSQLVAVHRDEGTAYSNFPVLLQNFGQVRPMIPMESDPPCTGSTSRSSRRRSRAACRPRASPTTATWCAVTWAASSTTAAPSCSSSCAPR